MKLDVEKLESYRKKRGWSKGDFAAVLGYQNPSGYSNLLKTAHIPRSLRIQALAELLGCPERKLFV